MTTRSETKTITKSELKTIMKKPDADVSIPEQPSQRKRPDTGPFRLKVDRQMKASYLTLEAAEKAGLAIKQGHPLVQVTVYDFIAGTNKTIEVPEAKA